ncbi:2'-5' RNA ligase family protein [Bdellovibrio sp. HCB288]|uniref:2'-5' RNA ligase family protein n=1 Tax=Bdellovibrio sp. HCB288 TaxID=3394355 RepID=UPI0039B46624
MYASGDLWKIWMKDYRFGALAFVPTGDLRQTVDNLRNEYDPVSAKTSMAHVTLTQPFAKAPSKEDIESIERIAFVTDQFDIEVGPAVTSPNKRLLWLDISPKDPVLALRESLHETGLFRTDLPLTKGFIPHMTISEAGREPDEVQLINSTLNSKFRPWSVPFSSVAWIIPDEDFVFREYRQFVLKVRT